MKTFQSLITLSLITLFAGAVSYAQRPTIQRPQQIQLPAGITQQQIDTYQSLPAHIAGIQSNVEVEQVSTRLVRSINPTAPALSAGCQFNANVFADKFHAAMKDQVNGYALLLRRNGDPNQTITLQWQNAQNNTIGWTPDRRMHVASVSKLITAIAMVKLLDDKGISLDAKIINYLPDYWAKGSNINQISFRNLLQHRSGFNLGTSSASDFNTMKTRVAAGVSGIGTYKYENVNYGLCRILIAVINGDINKSQNWPITNDAFWDLITIEAYRKYVQARVLNPAGVPNAGFTPTMGSSALAYRFPNLNQAGWNSGDLSSMSGGAGWRLSVSEVMRVLDHARRKGTILPAARMQFMLDNRLGIDQIIDTPWGKMYNKNGAWRDGSCESNARMEQCVAFFLPNGWELVAFVNSRIGAGCTSLRGLVSETILDSCKL